MSNKFRTAGVAALALTLPFTTASSVLAAPAPRIEDLDSLGIAESNEAVSSGLTAEANAAERSKSGNLLAVTWSIENNGGAMVPFTWAVGTSYMYENTNSYSGVTVTSSSSAKRHHPVMDQNGDCLCSGDTSLEAKTFIEPGDKVVYWSMFSVPQDVDSIDLEIPGFDPIEGIPIS